MKKIILAILLLISSVAYSQKYYTYIGPSVAFDVPLSDTKHLISGCFEVGKYLNNGISVGLRTGLYSLDPKDVYTHFVVGLPILTSNFSITLCAGYFYNYNDITLEYDLNYNIKLSETNSIIITYGAQSAFGTTSHSFSCGLNKDF
jgi:hypothetical protein